MDTRIDTRSENGTNMPVAEVPAGRTADASDELPVREAMRVNPVFGEPISAHGVTIVTVARVGAGTRGGIGRARRGAGLACKPLGAFVLSEGTVRWQPAVDVNRFVLALAAVAVAALVTARRIGRPRTRADRFLT